MSIMKENLENIAQMCALALKNGNKLLFCGNGGSAEFSNHMAAEFVCKLQNEREPLNALSLCSNVALISAIANDFGFKYVFSRQIQACAGEGDILFCISTSGKSENVLEACDVAKKMGVITVAMSGNFENPLKNAADYALSSEGDTAQIQENQLVLGHSLVRCVEEALGCVDN